MDRRRPSQGHSKSLQARRHHQRARAPGSRTELITTVGLKKVVDLPVSLDELDLEDRKAVHKFLAWAKTVGAKDSYVAQHRRAWWAIEGCRMAAPVLVT